MARTRKSKGVLSLATYPLNRIKPSDAIASGMNGLDVEKDFEQRRKAFIKSLKRRLSGHSDKQIDALMKTIDFELKRASLEVAELLMGPKFRMSIFDSSRFAQEIVASAR